MLLPNLLAFFMFDKFMLLKILLVRKGQLLWITNAVVNHLLVYLEVLSCIITFSYNRCSIFHYGYFL